MLNMAITKRKIASFVLLLSTLDRLYAQNDVCSTAIAIDSLPVQANGNTLNAELHLEGAAQACRLVSGPRKSSWFVHTATKDGCITASAKGVDNPDTDEDDGFETAMGVFSGNCEDLTCEAMNDDENVFSTDSVAHFTAQSNTTYYIMVTGWNEELVGSFDLTIEQTDTECGAAVETGSQYCNVCPDGGIPGAAALFNPGKRILCSEAAETFGVIEDTELCNTLQMMGSAVCRCEHPADTQVETCKLCPNGDDVPDPLIPISSIGETCGFLSDLEGEIPCRDLTRRGLASQCKCLGTLACDLCAGTEGSLTESVEITRGDTCADAQRFLEDVYTAYPSFLGCEPAYVDFHYHANVREVCCQGASLATVETTARTLPPSTSPLGSNGNNLGNGVTNTLENIQNTGSSSNSNNADDAKPKPFVLNNNSSGSSFSSSILGISISLAITLQVFG